MKLLSSRWSIVGRLLIVILLLISGAGLSGCAVNGLGFVRDDRISMETPNDGDEVQLPLKVEWRARDFDGRFALFFDRSPMRPGQSVLDLAGPDDPCRGLDTCGTEQWLADRDIYLVDRTSFTLDALADRDSSASSADRHQLTLVLLDDQGRRTGEAAFLREFTVKRDR